jgi:DNA-binding transcriptional ArsR family regulator
METVHENWMNPSREHHPGALPAGEGRPGSRPVAVTLPNPAAGGAFPQWTFLTNHAFVLSLLMRHPSIVLREVAQQVGITERAVQRIIADLEAGGIIEREKVGRQNHYRIRTDLPLRHPVESHCTIGDLLALIKGPEG